MVLLGPSDGRFGQVMVPFLHGQRMVPARAEPVLVTVTENQSSRHRVRLEERNQTVLYVLVGLLARSFGHLMLPKLAVPAN